MATVVVVGGGLGGAASAARLAKLGHRVTLVERDRRVGGALVPEQLDGHRWPGADASTLLPAVLRDLFRKSGRPLERELGCDLEPLEVVREHRFADGTAVRLPGGSRAAQKAALDDVEPGAGEAWLAHVDGYAETWDVLRRHYLEAPWDRESPPPALSQVLDARGSLRRRLRRELRDERLELVAGHPFEAGGHQLRDVPVWAGVRAFVEQRFGAWRVPLDAGGPGRLAELLATRLATRKVEVLTSTTARDVVVRGGRAVAVETDAGSLDADLVVCAIDPRYLPALAPHVARTSPAIPPSVVHVGLEGELPDLPAELVVHADPVLVVRTGGVAPAGGAAWTVSARGRVDEDLLTSLARHGVDVREQVVTRLDRSPRDLVERWGGSPLGVQWEGRRTVHRRLGPTTPVPGVLAAGAHAAPGAGIAHVGLSAALVAQVAGPA